MRKAAWAEYMARRLDPKHVAQIEAELLAYWKLMPDEWFSERELEWEVNFSDKILRYGETPRDAVRNCLWYYVHERENQIPPLADGKSRRRRYAQLAKHVAALEAALAGDDARLLKMGIHEPYYRDERTFDMEQVEADFANGLKAMSEHLMWEASYVPRKSDHVPGRDVLIVQLAAIYRAAGGKVSPGSGDIPSPFVVFCTDVVSKISNPGLRNESLTGLHRKIQRELSRLKFDDPEGTLVLDLD